MDPTQVFCPNEACPARGQVGKGRGIASAWLSMPSSVWKVTACVQARRGLRPKQPLFVRRYGPTRPNYSIPRSQLRNSYQ